MDFTNSYSLMVYLLRKCSVHINSYFVKFCFNRNKQGFISLSRRILIVPSFLFIQGFSIHLNRVSLSSSMAIHKLLSAISFIATFKSLYLSPLWLSIPQTLQKSTVENSYSLKSSSYGVICDIRYNTIFCCNRDKLNRLFCIRSFDFTTNLFRISIQFSSFTGYHPQQMIANCALFVKVWHNPRKFSTIPPIWHNDTPHLAQQPLRFTPHLAQQTGGHFDIIRKYFYKKGRKKRGLTPPLSSCLSMRNF